MNYARARQVKPDLDRPDAGKWRWTVRNDNQTWVEPCCQDCPGHDTEEGAQEHFRQWRIANVEWHVIPDDQSHQLNKCRSCGAFTGSYMTVSGDAYSHTVVCPNCHTPEVAEKLIEPTGSVMYS